MGTIANRQTAQSVEQLLALNACPIVLPISFKRVALSIGTAYR